MSIDPAMILSSDDPSHFTAYLDATPDILRRVCSHGLAGFYKLPPDLLRRWEQAERMPSKRCRVVSMHRDDMSEMRAGRIWISPGWDVDAATLLRLAGITPPGAVEYGPVFPVGSAGEARLRKPATPQPAMLQTPVADEVHRFNLLEID